MTRELLPKTTKELSSDSEKEVLFEMKTLMSDSDYSVTSSSSRDSVQDVHQKHLVKKTLFDAAEMMMAMKGHKMRDEQK